jgi:SM-20-related protein
MDDPPAAAFPTAPETVAAALAERGYAVVPGFLAEGAARALREELAALGGSGALRGASVGRGEDRRVRSEIRGDETLWLDPSSPTVAQRPYWTAMEGLRDELNRELFLGLGEIEAHYARYPAGAFYKPHLDCHRDGSDRVVSAILYLNSAWEEKDGGELRLYTDPSTGTAGPRLDVVPRSGTLALFLSADFWHEVLPARRERLSVTGWLRRRAALPA